VERWITFDCYGPLIDWRTGMQAAMKIVAPGRSGALLAKRHRIEYEIEHHEPYRPCREVLAESLRRMAREDGTHLYDGDEHILAAMLPFWPPYSDTGPALVELKGMGWRLCILSNVDRDLIAGTMRHFPVLFDLVITAQDIGSYKPNTAHIERFLDVTKVSPSHWVYAAVNHQYNLLPARPYGPQCVWINRDAETHPETSFLLGNLAGMAQLPGLLQSNFKEQT
jgi:2-haloacid dehalogenase